MIEYVCDKCGAHFNIVRGVLVLNLDPANRRDLVVFAEAHSDDRVVEVNFNATPYFETVDDEKLMALHGCGWSYDYPADDVVHFMAELSKDVSEIGTHIERVNDGGDRFRDTIGFGCSVNEEEAMTWIRKYRPHLLEKMSAEGVIN